MEPVEAGLRWRASHSFVQLVGGRLVRLDVTGRNGVDDRCRSHNPEVAGSNPAPATTRSPAKSPPEREGSFASSEHDGSPTFSWVAEGERFTDWGERPP
jgi:hypothetical protein